MAGLIYGIGLLFFAFMLHVIVWRLRVPKRQGRGILTIFAVVLFVGMVFAVSAGYTEGDLWGRAVGQLLSSINWIILYITCTLAYLISFTAIEADSPSLVMVKKILESGDKGLPLGVLRESVANDDLVVPRISDLVRDKMIVKEEGRLLLAPKGRILSQLFIYQRRLFRLGPGG